MDKVDTNVDVVENFIEDNVFEVGNDVLVLGGDYEDDINVNSKTTGHV